MSKIQPVYVTGTKSNATARRLLANTQVAEHIYHETIADEKIGKPVRSALIVEDAVLAGLAVSAGERVTFFESSIAPGRYFVVRQDGTTSASDARTAAKVQSANLKQAA